MEIANQSCFVFQTDSKIVQDVYRNQPNYLIEYNTQCTNKDYCAVYFCSNDIYYPNTEEIFKKRIIEKNFFEWYGSRIKKAYKHIFIRDCIQTMVFGRNQFKHKHSGKANRISKKRNRRISYRDVRKFSRSIRRHLIWLSTSNKEGDRI